MDNVAFEKEDNPSSNGSPHVINSTQIEVKPADSEDTVIDLTEVR